MDPKDHPSFRLDYAIETVLRPRISKANVICWILGVLVVGLGTFSLNRGFGAVAAAFVCLGILLVAGSVFHLIPGASFLRLNDAGFTVRRWFRSTDFRWDDIREFTRVKVKDQVGLIGIMCKTKVAHRGLSRQLRRNLARHHVDQNEPDGLIDPADYAMSAEQLIQTLEEFRQRHAAGPNSDRHNRVQSAQ